MEVYRIVEYYNIAEDGVSVITIKSSSEHCKVVLCHFEQEERKRHSGRPCLTGLAQINGRNNLGWNERLVYDIEYVKYISFFGDFAIIIKTIAKVL